MNLYLPRSVDEAVAVLGEHGSEVVILGGGTVVMAAVNDGKLRPRLAMSLARAGMNGVERRDGSIKFGATTTVALLGSVDGLTALAEAAGAFGGPALRAMATIGGNLFVQPPYGDLAVALLALDAVVELASAGERRWLPLTDFFRQRREAGNSTSDLVTQIRVPEPQGVSLYRKIGRRQANTPSVVSVAVRTAVGPDGRCREVRLAIGSVAPQPIRSLRAESLLLGEPLAEATIGAAAAVAMEDCEPPTDALATGWYRRRMVGVLVRRALTAASAG